MEGIEEALYGHTVGVVTDSGAGLGTAVAIRFRSHSMLLTANHVIGTTPDEDLRFFFRPTGTVIRGEWGSIPPQAMRLEASRPIQIFDRFQDAAADLAAVVVSPILDRQHNVRFQELHDGLKLPRPVPSSVAAIGFPADSRKDLAPNASAIAACTLWGNFERGKPRRVGGMCASM